MTLELKLPSWMGICQSQHVINPDRIDLTHFELMKVIGKGGFGKVNAISHRTTEKLFALKRMEKLRLVESKNKGLMATIWMERNLMCILNSPFTLNCIHAFQDPGELYLVMPFMAGGDMQWYLQKHRPFKERHLAFYLAEVLLGLHEIHSFNVVYRDLKPANILFDSDGHLRLSDFGIACQLSERNKFQTRGRTGTKFYLSPEALAKKPYGIEADYWALGITIFEMKFGVKPFSKDHQGGWRKILEEKFGREKYHCSADLQDIIYNLLRKADKRYGYEQLANHKFFKVHNIDFKSILMKVDDAPYDPDTTKANCSSNYELEERLVGENVERRDLTAEEQKSFERFNFNVDPDNLINRPVWDPSSPRMALNFELTQPQDMEKKVLDFISGKLRRESSIVYFVFFISFSAPPHLKNVGSGSSDVSDGNPQEKKDLPSDEKKSPKPENGENFSEKKDLPNEKDSPEPSVGNLMDNSTEPEKVVDTPDPSNKNMYPCFFILSEQQKENPKEKIDTVEKKPDNVQEQEKTDEAAPQDSPA